ncbi:hypothetical protein A4W74_04605 [Latilactobacillus curvatus]|uniref:hypothetical protein n=1 Tax=Latilactobacillus curvatus TaxID=28038 RepID=UPI0020A32420|nr:hypothetical protein [Latilactobacillus curvatus]UTB76005.1 hypothetical protein A4W74_04605 [Latilactobacillus curvatus]
MSDYLLFIPMLIGVIFLIFEFISLFFPNSLGKLRRNILKSDEFKTTISLIVGIATVTSVVYSVIQIKNINQQTKHEELILQAKNISIWRLTDTQNDSSSTGINFTGSQSGKLVVSNASKSPIYNVFVVMVLNRSSFDTEVSQAADLNSYKHFDIIPPGKTEFNISLAPPSMGQNNQLPIIYFTDTSNNEWLRYKNGNLDSYTGYENILNKAGINPPYL